MWTSHFLWLHLAWLWCYHVDNNTSFTRVDRNDWHCVAICNLKWMSTRGQFQPPDSDHAHLMHFDLSNTPTKFHDCILHSWPLSVHRQTNKHLAKYSKSFCGHLTTIFVSRTKLTHIMTTILPWWHSGNMFGRCCCGCYIETMSGSQSEEKNCHGTQLL